MKKDFSDWMKQQINDIGLEECLGYRFSPLKAKSQPTNGRPTKDYIINIRTAKEIAMVWLKKMTIELVSLQREIKRLFEVATGKWKLMTLNSEKTEIIGFRV